MKKMIFIITGIVLPVLLSDCSKETVEPELFGNLEGTVINTETGANIEGAHITFRPPTNSILTNGNGTFALENIPTGQYSITAEKSDYHTKTVNVQVREDQTTHATIPMQVRDNDISFYLNAEILQWSEVSINDSTYAEVQYEAANTSKNTEIPRYEIYFRIHAGSSTYSKEVSDTTLAAGERDIRDFSMYIRESGIDSVVISGTWTPQNE